MENKYLISAITHANAFSLNFTEPFVGVAGYPMPCYTDMRRLATNCGARRLVTKMMLTAASNAGITYDLIAGSTTAGIAHAASIAQHIGQEAVFSWDRNIYSPPSETRLHPAEESAVVATCPWAIPAGIRLANERGMDFLYVRKGPKMHGARQRIEGVYAPGQKAVMIDRWLLQNDSYHEQAFAALCEAGIKVQQRECHIFAPDPVDVSGKRILFIEDVINTGDSAINEMNYYRSKGAIIDHCMSIFTYGLLESENKLHESGIALHPLLTFDELTDKYASWNRISETERELLLQWRQDPLFWGEKNGFQKVKK